MSVGVFKKNSLRLLRLFIVVSLLPIIAINFTPSAFAFGSPFACDASLYQLSGGTLFKLNPASNTFSQVGSAPTVAGLDGIGLNPADNYLYGIVNGTTLQEFANDGTSIAAASISGLTNKDGADFLSNDQMLAVSATNPTLQLITLHRTSTAVTSTSITNVSLPGTSYTGASDIAVYPGSGGVSQAYALSGTSLTIFSLNSTSPTTATTTTKNVSGLPSGLSGSFDAQWVDSQGNLYAWDSETTPASSPPTKALYEISAADITGLSSTIAMHLVTETTLTGAGNFDGANCKTAPAPFGPQMTSLPVINSITATSANITGKLTTNAFPVNPLGTESNAKICYNTTGNVSSVLGFGYGLLTSAICISNNTVLSASASEQSFTALLTPLSPSTTYYYQVQATSTPNDSAITPYVGYGPVQSFSTIAPPSFTSITPAVGTLAGGTSATITGVSFSGSTAVTVGGTPVTNFTVNSSTSITITTPAGSSIGAADVVVSTPSGDVTGYGAFTYQTKVTYLANGGSGTMAPQSSGVAANLNPNAFTLANALFLGWNTLADGTGVSYADQTNYPFTSDLTLNAQWMTVTGITPSTGTAVGGTAVTITGTNFTNATSATVNGIALNPFTVVNSTTITGTTASGMGTGLVNVKVFINSAFATGPSLFTSTAEPQSITITSTPTTPTYGGTYTPTATGGGSGNAITYTSTTTSVCTVSSSVVHFIAAGSCSITANQNGNSNYAAATPVQQPITVLPKPLTITAFNQSTAFGGADPTNSFSVNSGGLVSPDTITSVTFTRVPGTNPGTYSITPSAASFGVGSSANYNINYVAATLTIDPVTTTTAGANGSISPSGTSTATYGGTQVITITPDTGYHVAGVSVDGAIPSAVTTVTFSNDIANHTVAATFAINTYTLTYLAGSYGSVSPATGQIVNWMTDGAPVMAVPDAGYHFTSWSDGITSATRTDLAVVANLTVTARFAINTFTLTSSAGSNGTVTPNGATAEGYGDTQEVVITPSSGYHVYDVKVDGVSVGAVTSYLFSSIAADHTLVATFAINTVTITYSAGSNGSISGGSSVQTIPSGTDATLVTAVANSGYHFVNWSDGVTTASRTDTAVTSDTFVSANFAHNTNTITASAGSGGTISPNGATVVQSGASLSITITPASGYHIVDVQVDGVSKGPVSSYAYSNISADSSIIASFAANTYTLTYTAGAHGTITAGSASQLLSYGGNGSAVAVAADTGYHFVSWSDGGSSTTRTDLNITSSRSYVANFAIDTFTITATAGSNGSISPSGTNSENYGYSQNIVIVPATGYYISDVLVDGSSVGVVSTYSFTNITANHTIAASFAASAVTLTYAVNGANGSLTGSVSQGLSYGGSGTSVTAVPATNYRFTAWSDGNVNPTRTDSNVKVSQTFTANFILSALVPVTYSVSYTSTGGGSITPGVYTIWNSGDIVLATFHPNAGYHISDVKDNGVSQGAIASYTINGIVLDHIINVTFAANPGNFTLTYTANSHGSVTGTTSQSVAANGSGTSVNAVPVTGYKFTSWSDGSTANPRTDTSVTANVSVSAQFAPLNTTTSNLIYIAGANGSVTGATLQTVNQGASGTAVTASPAAGYHFVQWSDNSTSATRSDIAGASDLSLTATFAQNTVTIIYAANSGGTISGTASQNIAQGGSTTAVSAQADGTHIFRAWSDGRTDNPRTDVNVSYGATYTANFDTTGGGGYSGSTLTITSSAGTHGSIVPNGALQWHQGDIASFSILPDAGYSVSDVIVDNTTHLGAISSYTFSNVQTDHTISATFVINSYTLTYLANAHGSLTGTTSQLVAYGSSGSQVTAVAANGYHFFGWSDGVGTAARTDSGVSADITVSAEFAPNSSTTYNLSYLSGTGGSVSGATSQTVNSGADGGSVTAVAISGYHFDQWSDGILTATRTDTSIAADLTVTANFLPDSYTLTYLANGSHGHISGSTPQVVVSGGSGSAVSASADSGFHFTSWSDGVSTAARTDSGVLGNITYTANFAADLPAGSTYTVTSSSGVHGSVSPTGAKVWNTGDIAGVYIIPDVGYQVLDVLVDNVSKGPQASWFFSNISQDHTVSATFTANSYTLTYSASSNGSLTGSTSQSVLFGNNGSAVTPVPDTGYHFVAWSDGSTANPRIEQGVSHDLAVTALFAIDTFTITASANANGTITPPGSVSVTYGQTQGFTFTPSAGYHVSQILVDSTTLGGASSYSFSNVTGNHSITVSFAINTYTLNYSANSNGAVSGTTSQTVNYGASGPTIGVVPAAGYRFSSWSDGSTTAPRTDVNVTANISVSANFVPQTFTVTASAGSNGTISSPGGSTKNYGDSAGYTITPNVGYQISSVTIDSTNIGSPTSYTFTNIQADHSISVSFAPATFSLTYSTNGYGTILGHATQSVGYGGSGTLVTASPQTGYSFTSWSDGVSTPSRTDSGIYANHTYSARFAINVYSVVSTTDTNGSITPLGTSSENYGYAQTYTFAPHTGYHIADVKIDGTSIGTPNTYTFSAISADHTIDVSYAINTYILTYTANTHGTISGTTPTTVNWGTNGPLITAQADTGYHFTTWSDGSHSASRTDLNITANLSVTASFAVDTFTITSTATSGGSVSPIGAKTENYGSTQGYTISASAGHFITSVTVDGSNLGALSTYTFSNIQGNHTIDVVFGIHTYNVTYVAGSGGYISGTATQNGISYGSPSTSVTATPNAGFHFVSWNDSNTNPVRFEPSVTATVTYTASFAATTFTLTTSAGSNGSVTPSGVTAQNQGSSPTVTITPSTGYHVLDVLVDSVSQGPITSYQFTNYQAPHTLSATFAINTYTLTYTANSNGTLSGTTTQTINYNSNGTTVTATPATGYLFSSWSDGVHTASRTDLAVHSNITVSANFAITQVTLTYTAGPNGHLSNTAPQTINYNGSGTLVTATGNPGYRFSHWSDGSTTASRIDTGVVVSATITASFVPDLYTLTYTAGTGGTVTGSLSQAVPSGTAGSNVTAIANSGYYFVNWSDGVTTASRQELGVVADKSVTANFALSAQTVTYLAGPNGSISGTASQSVNYGDSGTSVSAVANFGYHFGSWSDGSTSSSRSETNVTSNLSFTATFIPNTYNVLAIAGANGSITQPGTTVAHFNDSITYTITPSFGYQISSVLVDGNSVGVPSAYTFSNISAGHSIQVTFTPITFTITATAGTGGSVTPNGSVTVNLGQSRSVVISPASGFHIADVLVDGTSRGSITSINFQSISTSHIVVASFAANAAATHTVSYVASGAGSISGASEQSVADGGNTTQVTAVADKGSKFDSWSDGSTNPTRIDNNIKSDLLFSAKFITTTFIIISSAGPNGSITPSGSTTVNYGSALQVVMRPNSGYHVLNVQLDGNSIGTVNSYSFTNITAGHAISVTFAADATTTDPKPHGTPTPTPTSKPSPTPTSKPSPSPTPTPVPSDTPTNSPSPAPTSAPIVKEGTTDVKSIVDGGNDPVTESLLPTGNGVELSGKDWKIQIASDKKSVYGIALPSSLQIYLIRGVNATTSGSGFKPGTIARVYLYSTGIFLGQALVGSDGNFSTTFPVSAATTLGDHVMQVEGTSYDDKTRTAAVGLKVINKPTGGLVHLGTIYYDVDVSLLTPANIVKLASVFKTIQANGYKKIWIYGYTDIQTGVDNQVLSRHRSIRIAEMLNAILPQSIVGFKYFGPAKPKDAAHTQAAFAKNRRSEIWGQL